MDMLQSLIESIFRQRIRQNPPLPVVELRGSVARCAAATASAPPEPAPEPPVNAERQFRGTPVPPVEHARQDRYETLVALGVFPEECNSSEEDARMTPHRSSPDVAASSVVAPPSPSVALPGPVLPADTLLDEASSDADNEDSASFCVFRFFLSYIRLSSTPDRVWSCTT